MHTCTNTFDKVTNLLISNNRSDIYNVCNTIGA